MRRFSPAWINRILAVLICAAAAWACQSSPALAESSWTVTDLGLSGEETIFGMSCESSSLCVGVGQGGTIVTSTDPTGGSGAWAISHVALSEGLKGNLRGISCPSASLCVAVDYSGGIMTTTDPLAGGAAWKPVRIPGARSLFSISCATQSFCLVVGFEGELITATDPTGGAGAWKVTHLSEPVGLHSVSCVGKSLCVAGDTEGDLVSSSEPEAGSGAWNLTGQPGGLSPILGVSCTDGGFCTAGSAGFVLTSSAPTAMPAIWTQTPLASRFQILSVSCPSSSLCAASTNNGEITASKNPTGGSSAWSTVRIIPGLTNALFGLSCPSEALCVGAGKYGQLVTSIAPGAEITPIVPPPPPPPPRTRLLRRPQHRIRLGARRRTAEVGFRFGASGDATGFRCKLDRRPSAWCTSPRRYRIRLGRHTFRVKAVGPGGADPSPAVFHWLVLGG